MRFDVSVVPADAYARWLADTKASGPTLDMSAYAALAKPSRAVTPATYSTFAPGLFDSIVNETAPSAPGPGSGAGGQTQPLKKGM
jgi:cytochrome o ubiquinol oxidase subunit 2